MNPDIHHSPAGRRKKVIDPGKAANIGNLMRVTNRSGHAMRADAAVKLKGGDKAAFDMQMGVDETGHQDAAREIHLRAALVLAIHPNNRVTTNRHIGFHQIPGDQVKHPRAFQHQICGHRPTALINPVGK